MRTAKNQIEQIKDQKLFTVDFASIIYGRCVLLFPGVTLAEYRKLEIGDTIRLVKPDRSCSETRIEFIEHPAGIKYVGKPPEIRKCAIAIALEYENRVPVGTEVYFVKRGE